MKNFMKKNLFDIDYNNSSKGRFPSNLACKKINNKINRRKIL
tara:strand:- start:271 stop:396 length:126 start_codon:yes stop_codon:yes gene_type:complete